VALNPKSRIVPDLAAHWSVAPNGLTYQFTLRRGIVFQDGTPLNAAAYVATFDRLLNPATKAAVQAGRLGQVASVTATGAYSFQIVLKQPYAFLLYNLTDSNFMPLSPAALRREGSAFGRRPISTGPWEVQSWDTGTQIVLVRNPHYRGGPAYLRQGPVAIDRLIFRILPNAAAATDALLAGEVDVLALDAASVPRVQATGHFQILKTLDDSSIFLEFNVTRPPFNNLLVRQPNNYADNKN
jgi:peptide/nickel transport system substrate-binding protein